MKDRKKIFLKRPEFPGGKEAFKAYIKAHLVYPEKARELRIEGIVHLLAQIDDNGNVNDVVIKKGIGGGCDEEATRLVKNVRFGSVKNKGMRVKTWKRFRIEFRLPPAKKMNYTVVNTTEVPANETGKPADKKYSYTLHLKNRI